MTRERIGSLVLRAYPRETRLARGPEMLSMLLDASEGSTIAFTRECLGLVAGGARERVGLRTARPHRRHALAGFAVTTIVAAGLIFTSHDLSGSPRSQSNMQALAAAIAPHMRAGDLVLVAEPNQTTLAAHYLPVGLRYFPPSSRKWDAKISGRDRQAYGRLAGSDPLAALNRLLTMLTPGQHVLFIRPLTEGNADWSSGSIRSLRRHAAQYGALLARDPELRAMTSAPRTFTSARRIEDSAVLYVKS